jgi:uncharacterized protein
VTRPVPEPTPLSAPYWQAAREGRLELQRCRQCRRWIHFPDFLCPRCGSADLAFEEARGDGTVDTFTVVHRVFVPGFADHAPYAVGWVLLAEQPGLRVFADFVGIPSDRLRIGLPVTACFTERPGWGTVLSFTTV